MPTAAPTNPIEEDIKAIARFLIQTSYDDGVGDLTIERSDDGFTGQFVDRTDVKKIFEYEIVKSDDGWEIGYQPISGVGDDEDETDTQFGECWVEPIWNPLPFEFVELDYVEEDGEEDREAEDLEDEEYAELDSDIKEDAIAPFQVGDRVYWYEEDTNYSETLDYIGFKQPGIKQKTCSRGFSCGFGCISKNKDCAGDLPEQAKNYASWLAGQVEVHYRDVTTKGATLRQRVRGALDSYQLNRVKDSEKLNLPETKRRTNQSYTDFIDVGNSTITQELESAVKASSKNFFNFFARRKALKEMKKVREALLAQTPKEEAAKLAANIDFAKKNRSLKVGSMDSIDNPTTRSRITDMATEFFQMTKLRGGTTLSEFIQNSPRAYADKRDKLINVGSNVSKYVIFHEMAHHLENNNSQIETAARDWIKSRASGKAEKLSKITGVKAYDDEEIAIPDRFIDPYVGKVYKQGTEVISVGIERLHSPRAMLRFYKSDPEHFKLIVGILKSL